MEYQNFNWDAGIISLIFDLPGLKHKRSRIALIFNGAGTHRIYKGICLEIVEVETGRSFSVVQILIRCIFHIGIPKIQRSALAFTPHLLILGLSRPDSFEEPVPEIDHCGC